MGDSFDIDCNSVIVRACLENESDEQPDPNEHVFNSEGVFREISPRATPPGTPKASLFIFKGRIILGC